MNKHSKKKASMSIALLLLLSLCFTVATIAEATSEQEGLVHEAIATVKITPKYAPTEEELTPEALTYTERSHGTLPDLKIHSAELITPENIGELEFIRKAGVQAKAAAGLVYGEEVIYSKDHKELHVVVLEFSTIDAAKAVYSAMAKQALETERYIKLREFGDEGYAPAERVGAIPPPPYMNAYRMGQFVVYVGALGTSTPYDVKRMAKKITGELKPYVGKGIVAKLEPYKPILIGLVAFVIGFSTMGILAAMVVGFIYLRRMRKEGLYQEKWDVTKKFVKTLRPTLISKITGLRHNKIILFAIIIGISSITLLFFLVLGMYIQLQPGATLVEKASSAIEPILTVSRMGITITLTGAFIGYRTMLIVLAVLMVIGAIGSFIAAIPAFILWRRLEMTQRVKTKVLPFIDILRSIEIDIGAITSYRPGWKVLLPLAVIGLGIAVLFVIIVNACIGYVLTASATTHEPGSLAWKVCSAIEPYIVIDSSGITVVPTGTYLSKNVILGLIIGAVAMGVGSIAISIAGVAGVVYLRRKRHAIAEKTPQALWWLLPLEIQREKPGQYNRLADPLHKDEGIFQVLINLIPLRWFRGRVENISAYRPGRIGLTVLAAAGLGTAVLFVIIVNVCIGYLLTASATTHDPGSLAWKVCSAIEPYIVIDSTGATIVATGTYLSKNVIVGLIVVATAMAMSGTGIGIACVAGFVLWRRKKDVYKRELHRFVSRGKHAIAEKTPQALWWLLPLGIQREKPGQYNRLADQLHKDEGIFQMLINLIPLRQFKRLFAYRPSKTVLTVFGAVGLGIATVLFVIIVNVCIGYVLTASALTEPGSLADRIYKTVEPYLVIDSTGITIVATGTYLSKNVIVGLIIGAVAMGIGGIAISIASVAGVVYLRRKRHVIAEKTPQALWWLLPQKTPHDLRQLLPPETQRKRPRQYHYLEDQLHSDEKGIFKKAIELPPLRKLERIAERLRPEKKVEKEKPSARRYTRFADPLYASKEGIFKRLINFIPLKKRKRQG